MNVDWVKFPKTLAEKMGLDTSAKIDPRESGQGFNMGNCGVVGCWGTDSQGRKTLNGKLFEPIENSRAEQSVAYTQGVTMKLTCNDGTTGFGDYSKVEKPCKDNGGIKSLEPYTSKEPIYYILVTAGVLVAGYLAYKKFKK